MIFNIKLYNYYCGLFKFKKDVKIVKMLGVLFKDKLINWTLKNHRRLIPLILQKIKMT